MIVRIFSKIDENLADLNIPAELIELYFDSDGVYEIESLDKFLADFDGYIRVRKVKNIVHNRTDEDIVYYIQL